MSAVTSHTVSRSHDPVIRIRLSDAIQEDNYGVEGSTFYYCRLCEQSSGAGLLNKGIAHKSHCPIGRYEARVAKHHRTDEEVTK